ncbi:MAG: hypothetical protein ACLFPR_15470, partial [Desulfococcaceae bacterium]
MAKEQKNSIHFFVEFTLFSSVVNKKLGSREAGEAEGVARKILRSGEPGGFSHIRPQRKFGRGLARAHGQFRFGAPP